MKNENLNNYAKQAGQVDFEGMTLNVYRYQNQKYVKLRPIVEMLGLTWKHARETVFSADNSDLYGVNQFISSPTDTFFGEQGQFSPPYGGENEVSKLPVCILLERVEIYLARVSTARMRANGKEKAADKLLALQKEWAKVLHLYNAGETVGKGTDKRTLVSLVNAVGNVKNPARRQALEQIIDDELEAMGYVVKDPQQTLPI